MRCPFKSYGAVNTLRRTPEIDISELENLFSAAAPNTDRGKQGSRTAKGPKTEIVQLVMHFFKN